MNYDITSTKKLKFTVISQINWDVQKDKNKLFINNGNDRRKNADLELEGDKQSE